MILPLYACLKILDEDVHEAAADLGARPLQIFRNVTLPLAMTKTRYAVEMWFFAASMFPHSQVPLHL
jgi:ABC-type spermidine/putrescine transport system permease subunit I